MILLLITTIFGSPSMVDSLFYTSINEGDSFQCKRFAREAKKNHIKKSVINSYLTTAKKIYTCEEK